MPTAVPETVAVKVEDKGRLPEDGATDKETARVLATKLAMTFSAPFTATVQVLPLTLSQPDQLLKR